MLMDVAFWHMKHSAMIAAKDDLKIEQAKVGKLIFLRKKYDEINSTYLKCIIVLLKDLSKLVITI